MERRQFLVGAAAAASTAYSPLTISKNRKFKLGMVTSWPASLETLFGTARHIGNELEAASDGEITVEVFPAGARVGGLQVLDAVASGTYALGHTASYYYVGKHPANAFFTTIPFGLTGPEQDAWLIAGDGEDLWNELNARSNLIAFAAGQSGAQSGGWFNREINVPDDLKGLKMRFAGAGGEVMSRAGVEIHNLPGTKVYSALKRGVIEAANWASPYDDEILGLPRAAKYYYMPGWAEPGPSAGLYINRSIFKKLPADIRKMIPTVAHAANARMYARYEALNGPALKRLVKGGVRLRTFPDEVLNVLAGHGRAIRQEHARSDPFFARVYENWRRFRSDVRAWTDVNEYKYLGYLHASRQMHS